MSLCTNVAVASCSTAVVSMSIPPHSAEPASKLETSRYEAGGIISTPHESGPTSGYFFRAKVKNSDIE